MRSTPRAGEVPSIPAARATSGEHPGRAQLIWVRTGEAYVRIDDVEPMRLAAGEGVWIPADGWRWREIRTEPGTVAFPLLPQVSARSGAPAEPTRFEVPPGWRDWLIQHFNLQVTPLSGGGYSPDGLVDLLRRPGARRSQPPGDPEVPALDPPTPPHGIGARAVAEELTRDPALDLTVEEWAARVLSSPRTLRRDFLADTGLTFEQWRLRCRLIAAVSLLAAGDAVDQVTVRVGFASRNGFTRAFKQQFGITPYELAGRLAARSAGDPGRLSGAARQTDGLLQIVRDGPGAPAAPELLPATHTAPHANDVHVLSWMYRGSGYLQIGERSYERQRGVATWIPAAAEHVTGLRQNSISLPLGNLTTADLRLTEPLQVSFSPAWDDYLMFCAVSARSRLRPDDFDPTHILDLFRDQVAAQRALSVPMPTDPRAREVAMRYLRRIGGSGEPVGVDLPGDVHRAFRTETGMTFASWCYATRMRIARDLLTGGAKPSAVSRRVGYAHLPNFSAAFSRFHGLSPREYQERERA